MVEDNEFDLVSTPNFNKGYKVKVRVKDVTCYNPIIVIEE